MVGVTAATAVVLQVRQGVCTYCSLRQSVKEDTKNIYKFIIGIYLY